MNSKWTSRKFWMAIGTIIITIVIGLGWDVDPNTLVALIGAEGALWIVIEGIIDIVRK